MKYFIANNGQQSGPFELQDLVANGLTPNSLVWCDGMAGWQQATSVPEVAQLLMPQQPQYQEQPYQQPPYQQQYQQQPYQQQPYQQQPYSANATMGFGEAIKVCFNKYADFSGRASRAEFWWFYLFTFLVSLITCGVACLVFLIPQYAVGARRLHDTGRSGWLQLLGLVPFVGLILIYWWVLEGDQGTNQYGGKPIC
ncbi:MAG: DUF805 domain-containing protein [Bacteroidales bacterium]|nr:DUF805 domain-containing protein [Bacteroidales bacterium]